MTLLADPRLPEPITIGPRTYLMKPATTAERTRWRRAIAAAGGRQHGPGGLLNCLAAGIRSLMKGSPPEIVDAMLGKVEAQRDRVIAFFEAAREATLGGDDATQTFIRAGQAMNEGDADLAVIVAEVTANYPAYAQMVADESTYWSIVGMESLRMFCLGFEGITVDVAGEAEGEILKQQVLAVRGPGGLTDESLAEVPEGDLAAIGTMYENLVKVTPAQRKNLLSQRPGSPAAQTSATSKTQPQTTH